MTEASTIGHCGEQDLAALTSGNALTPPSASTQVPETKRLLFGPYSPPLIAKGGVLYCERRGKLEVGSYSHAPIPWPMKKGKHSIILCGDLVKAVKLESVEAVAYHWNVSRALVQSWRKILHVPEFNPGTRILRAAIELALRPAKAVYISKRPLSLTISKD